MKYLNDNRIIYRKYSDDPPTKEYKWGWYYAEGTYGYYSLFNSPGKITTIKSLKWHLLTLWWLNPDMKDDKFNEMAKIIAYKKNGFTTFNISDYLLDNVIKHIYMQDLDRPPNNKLRKIVFKDFCGLDLKEKLVIVGKLAGRSTIIDEGIIYQVMLDMHDNKEIITIKKIAEVLKCSSRTIHRNMSLELKKEKDLLNIENEKI